MYRLHLGNRLRLAAWEVDTLDDKPSNREQMGHVHYYNVIVHRLVMLAHISSVPNAICLPPTSTS